MTAFRALALLAAYPDKVRSAELDLAAWRAGELDVLISAPLFSRQSGSGRRPRAFAAIDGNPQLGGSDAQYGHERRYVVPFYHRDEERLPEADRFVPELWLGNDPAGAWPFVPFNAGPLSWKGDCLPGLRF